MHQLSDQDIQRLSDLMNQTIERIETSLNRKNPFHQLESIKRIIDQRNVNHFPSLIRKLNDALRLMAENGMDDEYNAGPLREVYAILNKAG